MAEVTTYGVSRDTPVRWTVDEERGVSFGTPPGQWDGGPLADEAAYLAALDALHAETARVKQAVLDESVRQERERLALKRSAARRLMAPPMKLTAAEAAAVVGLDVDDLED